MITTEWVTVSRPGYFGKKRNELLEEYRKKYNEFRIAWEINGKAYAFPHAIQLYEDAYFIYFFKNYGGLLQLVETAKDVYDNEESNIGSGLNYNIQEASSNHYQDISIRRVLSRFGLSFKGTLLVQIRHNSKSVIGRSLSPGRVPFHLKRLIMNPELTGWWYHGSLEAFWQTNKILQVPKEEIG